jgi:hypothetical protein
MNKLITDLLAVENDTDFLRSIFNEITYSPEDNKLRLYANFRFDKELWLYFKSIGLKYAPKQELFVFNHRISREDLCLFLLPEGEEIQPEGTTLAERAEIKAERLAGYYDNRVRDMNIYSRAASQYSERFAQGQPILVGHHSEKSARRDQKRADSAMNNSLDHARRADYWSWKIAGVAHYANMKASTRTRVNRIETLLKDLRDCQKTINNAQVKLKFYKKALASNNEDYILKVAIYNASYETSKKLENGELEAVSTLESFIKNREDFLNNDYYPRLISHILNRVAYEKSLLPEAPRVPAQEITNALLKKCLVKHGCPSAPKEIKLKLDKAEDTITVTLLNDIDLPVHIGEGSEITKTRNEWSEFLYQVGYVPPVAKPKAPTLLNIKEAGYIKLRTKYTGFNGATNFHICKVVGMTKAEYSDIYSDYKGTWYTEGKEARIRICKDPKEKGQGYSAPWIAVYLTDMKTHPTPDFITVKESIDDFKEVEA